MSIVLSVSSTKLSAGQADTLRVVVKNNLTNAVRVIFPTSCQVFFTVRSQAGDVVTPRNGRPLCLPATSQLNLLVGGTQTFTTIWTGGYDFKPPDTSDRVPPGFYFVSAALVANGYSTVAPAYKVEIAP